MAVYSITSSARASSDCGTASPSAFGGFEVDDQLVLRWRLHRQIGWLLALQDAINVAGRAPILIDEIRPAGDQAAIWLVRKLRNGMFDLTGITRVDWP